MDSNKKLTEPTEQEIKNYMEKHNENYYNSRERLRELVYGNSKDSKPPHRFSD